LPFLQFSLDLGSRNPEPYEDALFALGALSVTLADAADDPVLEPAPGAMPLWPTVVVHAVFAADADTSAIRTALSASPGLDPLLVAEKSRFEAVADRAWEREWLKDFRPMQFGRRLWVCPGGQRPSPDVAADAIVVDLDPGLAFGTGTHATTALCLEWLEALFADDTGAAGGRNPKFLLIDYGCGSGILAIAALRLGADRAIGVDIDEQALIATRENAERNAVSDRLEVTTDRACDGAVADVLVANILAGPLVELAPLFATLVRTHGRIALSGLLLEQVESVTAAYRPWFDIDLAGVRDGWGLLAGSRRDDDGHPRPTPRDQP
jgi:ribosomal protein L11 methyltransferase